jgi:hypothetical protein
MNGMMSANVMMISRTHTRLCKIAKLSLIRPRAMLQRFCSSSCVFPLFGFRKAPPTQANSTNGTTYEPMVAGIIVSGI